ncbi:MAG: glycosyltransferase family A protein [Parafilimonas sp.]
MNIEVSVIIPTYKRPALLIKCLTHLAAQNFSKEKYEVIVVTDGPDYDTKNEVMLFSQQHMFFNLSCYNLNEKKGPAAARNKGVQYAKGSLIVFTDDDCLPQAEWLSKYWDAHTSNHENIAAFTGRTIVPNLKTPTDYDLNVANLQTAEFITANCAITKQAFNIVGGFDEAFPIAWREDSDMHFKLIEASVPIYHVNKAAIIHPVRKAGWGISLKEQKKSVFNALLYKKHPELYRQKISAKGLWKYYAMIYLFIFFAICLVRNFDFLATLFFLTWLFLLVEFIVRRLKYTSKKLSHVLEMIVTSALIPFFSVFWTIYGSLKYKTFLL